MNDDDRYVNELYNNYPYNFMNPHDVDKLAAENAGIRRDENPVFTIMMCVYNDCSLLNSALNSVLTQDFSSWELLILDNSDKSKRPWRMLQNAMKADSRIIGKKSDENVGWAKGSELLLKEARGQYVTFLAADDVLERGAFRKIDEVICKDSPDVIFIGFGGIDYIEKKQAVFKGGICPPVYRRFERENRSAAIVEIFRNVFYNSMFHYIRVDFLKKNGINFFSPYYADSASMTAVMAKAERIICLNEILYFLTLNTSQTVGRYAMGSWYDGFVIQWKELKKVFEAENYFNISDDGERNKIYVVNRIWKNLLGNIENLCAGHCRNLYMNSIEVTEEELILELKDIFENEEVLEMMDILGKKALANMSESAKCIVTSIRDFK